MSTANRTADGIARLGREEGDAESPLLGIFKRFIQHRMAVFGVILLSLIVLYVTVGAIIIPEEQANKTNIMFKFEPPSAEYPFGTDEVGRDVLARTIYGGQISLMIGIVSVTIAVSLGTLVGLLSGYYGGVIDALLMRFVEALLAIPTLVLLLVISRSLQDMAMNNFNFFGRELSVSVVGIVVIIGLTSWMSLSRLVRSLVLSLKSQDFILAARALGSNDARIIFRHILPNTFAPIIVNATLGVGAAIIVEAALSFLGFGVVPPTATWGNIITRARQSIGDLWWIWVFPGSFITMTVLAINFIGDGLRDALDPRSKK